MTTNRIVSGNTNSIGWGNEAKVNSANDTIARTAYEGAKARGEITLTPLKPFEVTKLKAELNNGTKSPGDRSVDLGNGERLLSVSDRVYLRSGDSFSSVSGFTFPPMRMASPRRM